MTDKSVQTVQSSGCVVVCGGMELSAWGTFQLWWGVPVLCRLCTARIQVAEFLVSDDGSHCLPRFSPADGDLYRI